MTNNKLPVLIAHRGASHDAPENTLAAFRLAWEQGADGIEGDFHLTQDQVIVCVHDEVLLDSTGKEWVVAQSTYTALTQAFPFIPTLKQVLDLVPNHKRMVIEIKCDKAVVPLLLQHLEQSSLTTEQVMVIAFDAEVIAELKLVAPQWTGCWLTELEINQEGQLVPSTSEILKILNSIKADGVSTFAHPAITPEWIKPILAVGQQWHVWTVDEVLLAKQLIECGVQSLTTNVPKVLREQLKS